MEAAGCLPAARFRGEPFPDLVALAGGGAGRLLGCSSTGAVALWDLERCAAAAPGRGCHACLACRSGRLSPHATRCEVERQAAASSYFRVWVRPLHGVQCKAMHTLWSMELSVKGGHVSYSSLGLVLMAQAAASSGTRSPTCSP
jgi:hypothetical protein